MTSIGRARRGAVIAAAVLVAGMAAASIARLAAQDAAQADRPALALARAVVQALTIAQSIEQALDRVDRNRLGDSGTRFEGTNAARTAQDQAREAMSILGRPIGAPGDSVRRSAGAFRSAFGTIAMQMNEAIGAWDRLARADNENDTSDAIRALTSVFTDERPWQMLHQATRDLAPVLTAENKPLLTREEREALLAELGKSFPRLGTSARGGGHAYSAAAVFHELLTRPE